MLIKVLIAMSTQRLLQTPATSKGKLSRYLRTAWQAAELPEMPGRSESSFVRDAGSTLLVPEGMQNRFVPVTGVWISWAAADPVVRLRFARALRLHLVRSLSWKSRLLSV